MKQLDELLETKPTEEAVKEMAELRIRNLQAFDELQSFNDTGKFLCKHPLLAGRSEISREALERHQERERLFRMILEQEEKKHEQS